MVYFVNNFKIKNVTALMIIKIPKINTDFIISCIKPPFRITILLNIPNDIDDTNKSERIKRMLGGL